MTETKRLFSFSILNKFIRIHASVNFVEKQTFQFHNSWKRYFYSQIFNNVCKLKHVHLKYLAKRHISLKVRTWIILHIIVDKSVHLGNLQHAGWFKIVQADKWVCEDLQNDFVINTFLCMSFFWCSALVLIWTVSLKILMSNLICKTIIEMKMAILMLHVYHSSAQFIDSRALWNIDKNHSHFLKKCFLSLSGSQHISAAGFIIHARIQIFFHGVSEGWFCSPEGSKAFYR